MTPEVWYSSNDGCWKYQDRRGVVEIMDPNETLRQIRKYLSGELKMTSFADLDRFVELVEALDTWMTMGGFLPDEWKKERS